MNDSTVKVDFMPVRLCEVQPSEWVLFVNTGGSRRWAAYSLGMGLSRADAMVQADRVITDHFADGISWQEDLSWDHAVYGQVVINTEAT